MYLDQRYLHNSLGFLGKHLDPDAELLVVNLPLCECYLLPCLAIYDQKCLFIYPSNASNLPILLLYVFLVDTDCVNPQSKPFVASQIYAFIAYIHSQRP